MKNSPVQQNTVDSDSEKRSRTRSQSTGKRVKLTPVDLERFAFIQRHGDLPTSLLYQYSKLLGLVKNLDATRNRLKVLFHERNTPHGGRYITRHSGQRKTENFKYNFAVYRLTQKGEQALKEAGLHVELTPRSSNSWLHDFQRACYSASIELQCMESDDLEYISHHEIVERIGKDSFMVNKEEFIPDVIHGIRHKGTGAVRLYMVEIDRNTESVSSYKFKLASFQHKLEQYHKYIAGGLYKKDFGINGGILLVVVTNNITHMHNLIELAGKSNFMLFASVPKFGVDFAPPSKPFDLVESPLLRPGKEPFFMNVS